VLLVMVCNSSVYWHLHWWWQHLVNFVHIELRKLIIFIVFISKMISKNETKIPANHFYYFFNTKSVGIFSVTCCQAVSTSTFFNKWSSNSEHYHSWRLCNFIFRWDNCRNVLCLASAIIYTCFVLSALLLLA
jgi:hypothetical protein